MAESPKQYPADAIATISGALLNEIMTVVNEWKNLKIEEIVATPGKPEKSELKRRGGNATLRIVHQAPSGSAITGYHESQRVFVDDSCAEFTDTILVKDGGPTT